MAGEWIKMRADLSDDPAVIEMAAKLAVSELLVIGALHKLWSWADKHTFDGNATGVTYSWVNRYLYVPDFAEAMESCGWLVKTENGIKFPLFERHNGETAKKRALTNKRVAEHRQKVTPVKQECNAPTVTESVTREEKRREEVITTLSGKPGPSQSRQEMRSQAVAIISFLNEKTGRNYQPVDANVTPLLARFKEGFSPTIARQVVAKKAREWGSNEKMEPYLRPATLFNKTNFANYAGEIVQ